MDFDITDDIFRDIIQGSIENLLRGVLGVDEEAYNPKTIEYQPVWSLDEHGEKFLKYLNARISGEINFNKITNGEILDTGATCKEVIEYLSHKGSLKITPTLHSN